MLFRKSLFSVFRSSAYFLVFSFLCSPAASAKEAFCNQVLRKVEQTHFAAVAVLAYVIPKATKAVKKKWTESSLARIAENTAKPIGQWGYHYLKGTKYPLFGIWDSVREFNKPAQKTGFAKIAEILRSRWEKDRVHLTSWASLSVLHLLTGMSFNAYQNQTADFDDDEESGEGLIVVVDNMGQTSSHPGFGTYIFNSRYKGNPKAILLKDISLAQELPLKLKELAETHHLPIKKVDIYADGLPGIVTHPYFNSSITDVAWDSLTFPGRPIQQEKDSKGFWNGALYEAKLEDGILSPGAKIRVNADYVGRGEEGELYTRAAANTYLRHGGKYYTSTVSLHPDLADYMALQAGFSRPPSLLRTAADFLFPELALKTAFDVASLQIKMRGKDTAFPLTLPSYRVREVRVPAESALKRQFESRWSAKLEELGRPYHDILDNDDLEHYTKVGALSFDIPLASEKTEAIRDHVSQIITLKKDFDTEAHAREYLKALEVDRDLIETPELSGKTLILKSKPDVYEVLRARALKERAIFSQEVSSSLKKLYEEKMAFIQAGVKAGIKTKKEAAQEKKELQNIYHHYSTLTGVYHYPWWGRNWRGETGDSF